MICFSFLFGFIQLGSFRLFVSLAVTVCSTSCRPETYRAELLENNTKR